MKSKKWISVVAVTLFAALAMPAGMAAQDTPSQDDKSKHHQYKLIDIGTFGGPTSYYSEGGTGNLVLNNRGVVTGYADTPTPDPYAPYCYQLDCFVAHAFRWQQGVLTDLGALPGVNSSNASGINERGWVVGVSENGVFDPTLNFPAAHAVLWTDRQMIDLGTLGGYESNAIYVNDGGQVVGFATNTIPDPFSFLGAQTHTFIWQDGVMRDLGTLGGPDSFPSAGGINEREGLVAGGSYTNFTPNPVTGIPTQDPFLWRNGTMTDLGTLGGTNGFAVVANNRGQVAGQSNLAGDLTFHPFLWGDGVLTDLGTLGGDNGTANWLNDAGAVVGRADLPGSQTHDAFLWKGGVMKDLGRLGGDSCTNAHAINSSGQSVGCSSDCISCLHAFLWENGGPMVDLNSLIPSNSSLQLTDAENINERGEIAGLGLPAGCQPADVDFCGHVYVLIPCDEKHPGECEDYSMIEVATSQTSAYRAELPATMKQGSESPVNPVNQLRNRLMQRYHMPGQPAAPRD